MAGTKLAFHFEQAPSVEKLHAKIPGLTQKGWKPASHPREVEVKFSSGHREKVFSQTFVRPALFPVCQRIGSTLPARFEVLAGAIKPCEHFVHFYDDESLFVNSLEAFITEGLMAGEAVVVIALPAHRALLEERLKAHGLDLPALEADRQLLLFDAQATLDLFLWDGMPDEELFGKTLGRLLTQVRSRHRTVRAFGEMVGILWANGNRAATLRLEEIWHRYCQREGLVLYCAYRRSDFVGEQVALKQICESHSQLIEA